MAAVKSLGHLFRRAFGNPAERIVGSLNDSGAPRRAGRRTANALCTSD
jgi:hypothetical protein